MNLKNLSKIPARSIWYLLICLGGLLAFYYIGVHPYNRTLSGLEEDIAIVKFEIEKQETLSPLFKSLLKEEIKPPEGLPFPEKGKLSRENLNGIAATFRDMAQMCNLELGGVTPMAESLDDQSGLLKVSVMVKGDFFDCRRFLLKLGEIPYMEHIEQIQFLADKGMNTLSLNVWLAVV